MRCHLALILVVASSAASHADVITSDYTLACEDRGRHERMDRVAGAGDREGVVALINDALRSGTCEKWKAGMQVRVEERSGSFACAAPTGSTMACLWIRAREVAR